MALRRWLRAMVGGRKPERQAALRRPALERLEGRCVPAAWAPQISHTTQTLNAVWGSGPDDVFAVGVGGTIQHSNDNGAAWDSLQSPSNPTTTATLNAVWGSGSDVFAVGTDGTIQHSSNDGASWQTQTSGVANITNFNAVWGSGPDDVFAVGNQAVIISMSRYSP